jgi:hypothetical protein
MTTLPFVIVADRGQFKAFKIDRTDGGRTSPKLVDSLFLSEPRERYDEKLTDQAGAFPKGGTAHQGNSIAERMALDSEEESRTFRRLAGEIVSVLENHRPARWGFAAPSEINGAILDGLPEEFRKNLTLNLPLDLINVPQNELISHFEGGR